LGGKTRAVTALRGKYLFMRNVKNYDLKKSKVTSLLEKKIYGGPQVVNTEATRGVPKGTLLFQTEIISFRSEKRGATTDGNFYIAVLQRSGRFFMRKALARQKSLAGKRVISAAPHSVPTRFFTSSTSLSRDVDPAGREFSLEIFPKSIRRDKGQCPQRGRYVRREDTILNRYKGSRS